MASAETWALCSWIDEHNADLIHTDDLARYRRLAPLGGLFTVLANDGEYTVIGSGNETYRVRPDALQLIEPDDSWLFDIGETVGVKDRHYVGTVTAIGWHRKHRTPMYTLEVEGKVKSKRYWPADLERIPAT